MRRCLYGILAAVFLCMWKAGETDANKEYAKYIAPFFLYNDADWLYNGFNILARPSFLKNAKEYIKHYEPYTYNLVVNKDYMIKQHLYISALRNDYSHPIPEHVLRTLIMLNFSLTLEAYEAAVAYRVCAFFYSNVKIDFLKYGACWKLSLYFEWYFSFMLEEKAEVLLSGMVALFVCILRLSRTNFRLWQSERKCSTEIESILHNWHCDDLCTIKKYFSKEENTFSGPLKAENMCKILKKLNMNFLKFPQDPMYVDPLQYDENNVYNPEKLTTYDSDGDGYFISVFRGYEVPSTRKNQSRDEYEDMVHYDLWSLVMAAYTDKYFELLHYLLEIIKGIPLQRNYRITVSNLQIYKIMWDYAPQLNKITILPTQTRRGVVSYTTKGDIESNIGNVIYRSNAVEILRQISYFFVLPTFINADLNLYDIMKTVNSSNLKCYLEPAPKELNLSVDCVFHINTEDVMPLL